MLEKIEFNLCIMEKNIYTNLIQVRKEDIQVYYIDKGRYIYIYMNRTEITHEYVYIHTSTFILKSKRKRLRMLRKLLRA